ncbi:alkaline phosphatase family protein [Natrialbaceae archaeon A-gly3]
MKTVIIGLDALDFRYLERFESSLPNITALRERGVEAPLESTHPPWTGSAWPSMYTGADPSYHGIYNFFKYDGYPDEGSLVSNADVRVPAIWEYLSSVDVRSIVMNIPVTHPAKDLEGVLLPGYLAPEGEPGSPEGIREEVSEAIGEEYTIYSHGEVSDDPGEKFEGYCDLIDQRRRAGLALLENHEWEFAFLQVQKTDAVFHNFTQESRFREIYEAADRLVGDVITTVGDQTNVVLCSDHGIGPVTGYQIYINEILREHGYLETTSNTDKLTIGEEKHTLLKEDVDRQADEPGILERTLRSGRRSVSRLGIEPADVYVAASRVGLESTLVKLTPDSLKSAINESVDWRASRAYCPSGTVMGIRINLSGREPEGVVSSEEYEEVRDDLITLLEDVETPDGEPAFERICRREEIYDGPVLEGAPDICFLPTEMNHTIATDLIGRKFVPVETYNHKLKGAFVGAGPGFTEETTLEGLSLSDIAPITMGLLEQPVPTRMTGSIPDGLLEAPPEHVDYEDVSSPATASEPTGDNDAVTERLKDLGYL